MKRVATLCLLLALIVLPGTLASADQQVDCHYFCADSAAYVAIDGAGGQPFRVYDLQGAMRAQGVATSDAHFAVVPGARTAAVHLVVGGQVFLLQAESDDIWQ